MRYLQIESLFSDWQKIFVGGRLQKVYAHGPRTFSLLFYRAAAPTANPDESVDEHKTATALLDFSHTRSHFLFLPPEMALARTAINGLGMALRKHLAGRRLQALQRREGDRWLGLDFGENASQLVLELSGRHGNLFLLNAQRQLVVSLRADHSERQLRSGSPYLLPSLSTVRGGRLGDLKDPFQLADLPPALRGQRFAEGILAQRLCDLQRSALSTYQAHLKQGLQRIQRRQQTLHQALENLDDQQLFQQQAERLQGAFANPPAVGATEVWVTDYFDPQQAQVRVALEPHLNLQENIARYYQRAKKIERRAEYALEHLPELEAEQARWELELQRADQWHARLAQNQPLIAEDWERLQAQVSTRLPATKPVADPGRETGLRRYARCFEGAVRMWVGKSAKGNHQLTFRYAKGNDYWFHVQDTPGSHVLVKSEHLNAEILAEAAHLAAYYSPQRQAFLRGNPVAVSYTQIKSVKAIKGAPPGQVQLQRFNTYSITEPAARWKAVLS